VKWTREVIWTLSRKDVPSLGHFLVGGQDFKISRNSDVDA
jgi:hypothetical protein